MKIAKEETPVANPFRTVGADGRPVLRRFSSARAVREIYKTLQEQDASGEAPRRAKIKNMYDFFRPWDPQKLAAVGVRDMANVNCGGLAGQVDARAGAISDMALDTTDLIELRPIQKELSGPDADAIGAAVAEEFSTVLREGREFLPAVATMVKEADLYGLGPIGWPDPFDYQPVALERGNLKFPDDASAISSKNELLMVESVIPAWYLFRLFDNPADSATAGWNMSAVRAYLTQVFSEGSDTTSQSGDSTGTSVPESMQAEYRQNRRYEARQFETLRVVNAYVREVSGDRKITHYLVPTTETPDDFLFVKEGAYETMDQCLLWLPYSATERYARGLRGLASKILPYEDLRNRTFCKIIDAAMREASIKLEGSTSGEGVRNTIVEQGPYTFFTGNVKPVTGKTAPDFTGLAAVHEMIGRVSLNNVTGMTGVAALPERVYSGADRKTKNQIQIEATAGAKSEQALFCLRSMVFDAVFRECFRRFMKLVLDKPSHARYPGVAQFVERCDRRGVTMAMLKQVPAMFSVYMCRDLVTGGAGAKAGILENILGTFGGNLDEKGRLDATHDYIRASAGRAAADRYRPMINRDSLPGDASSHALLENNDLMEGSPVMVGSDQLHWSHIPIHSQLLAQITEAVRSGQVEDPARMLQTLQATTAHTEEHIQKGGTQLGKEEDAKAAIRALRSLRPVGQSLTMMAQTQEHEQEAQAKRQQAEQEALQKKADGQEAQAAMHDSDNKAAVKLYEVDKMHEARMASEQSKASTDAFRAQAKASIDRISAQYRSLTKNSSLTGIPPPGVDALSGDLGTPGEGGLGGLGGPEEAGAENPQEGLAGAFGM
jgi:hypothetical protein